MDADTLPVTRVDAGLLLAAAESGWDRPVPHCPEWDLAQLVRHTGEILAWMAAVVTARSHISRRALPPAPEAQAELPLWYQQRLEETLHILSTTDPTTATWTFSSLDDHRVGWWIRRLAVEVAVHRWDAQHARNLATPMPVDGAVGAAGIEEFLTEFLPGLLDRAGPRSGLTGTLHLHATDGPTEWFVDLARPRLTMPEHRRADTVLHGTRSDLLLWLTNRAPANLDVIGQPDIVTSWAQLSR